MTTPTPTTRSVFQIGAAGGVGRRLTALLSAQGHRSFHRIRRRDARRRGRVHRRQPLPPRPQSHRRRRPHPGCHRPLVFSSLAPLTRSCLTDPHVHLHDGPAPIGARSACSSVSTAQDFRRSNAATIQPGPKATPAGVRASSRPLARFPTSSRRSTCCADSSRRYVARPACRQARIGPPAKGMKAAMTEHIPDGEQSDRERPSMDLEFQMRKSGWVVQDRNEMDLAVASGVAVRDYPDLSGGRELSYVLFVDRKAAGVAWKNDVKLFRREKTCGRRPRSERATPFRCPATRCPMFVSDPGIASE